jgi:hypothetical protein
MSIGGMTGNKLKRLEMKHRTLPWIKIDLSVTITLPTDRHEIYE